LAVPSSWLRLHSNRVPATAKHIEAKAAFKLQAHINPYKFNKELLLQNNPEVNVAKIQIDLTIGFYLFQKRHVYETYGRDAFENDKIQWLDQSGSLLHLLLDYFVVAISH
jgi:hypothetical protein